MALLADIDHCTGCSACAMSCPKACIQMQTDEEGFRFPAVDHALCIECGLCTRVCPVLTPPAAPAGEPLAYAAACTAEEVRRGSTSGGVFTLLARWVFDRGGVVFGAAYDQDFSVVHCSVEVEDDLWKLRTAKYAQSDLGTVFSQVRTALGAGRCVLFSGTPCQVAGLRSYLRKPYENLILVDLVCHGVPSPAVWRDYLRYRRQTDAEGAALRSVNLRSKETGWPGYSVRFEYENGSAYSARNNQDPFLRAFVGNLCLRPSCYHCECKGLSRNSDFTLADYWGVWSQLPAYNDGKGTSLVLVHSQKGQAIWKDIQPALRCQEVEAARSLEENPSALVSSDRPEARADFMARYASEPFGPLVDQLRPVPPPPPAPSGVHRCLGLAKRLAKKLLS